MPEKTLICLHGFTHNGRFFEKLAQTITKNPGWKVICPTFFGRGDQVNLEESLYTYSTYVEYLGEITKDIKDFSILGSSMGGIIAMMFIHKSPNKVKNLILNDVGDFISSEEISRIGEFVSPNISFSTQKELDERLRKEFSQSNLNDDELGFIKEIYTDGSNLKYDPKIANAFWRKGKQKRIPDFDLKDIWSEVVSKNKNMKTLIIRGKESNFLSPETLTRMKKSENIEYIEVENTGHLPLFFKEKEINIIEKFLYA